MVPPPWQWTPTEWRIFADWWVGFIFNRTTIQVALGLIIGMMVMLILIEQMAGPTTCKDLDAAVYLCTRHIR